MKVINPRTELKVNPIGLGSKVPRLSWELEAQGRGIVQQAFQVKCATNLDDLKSEINLLWNSGKINSDQSVHVEYKGVGLLSGQKVFWQVRVWTNKDESDWSMPSFWEMGLLEETDWNAKWIEPYIDENISESTPCPYLRKEFSARGPVLKATAFVTCHGLYELSINGQKISNELFTPGWTSYRHRLQYQAFDVSKNFQSGQNTIGIILADGWYRGFLVWQGNKNLYGDKLALLLQIRVDYADGTHDLIISDDTWKSAIGPLLKSDIYNGEIYDSRLEQIGWNMPGYNDANWSSVIIKDYGFKNLVSSESNPVRITQSITPVEKIITPKGELVFDLGQNIVGWVHFSLKGKPGSQIAIKHAEVLDQEGNFYTDNLRDARAEDIYIFKGDGIESYEPRFTFHGFRYIKISGYEGEISPKDLQGRVVHTDMDESGEFECSDELVNRLQKNIQWGLRGNFIDVPTDCPQRDERLGWTGDAQVFASTACFNMNASAFYRKWMKDFIVDQKPDGSVPWVVPNVVKDGGGTGWSDGFGATGWSDAAVIIPWTVYMAYGDKRILSEQYKSMKAWEEYMIRESGDNCIFSAGFHFGDWLSFADYYSYNYNAPDYGYAGAHTDKELIATAYYYFTTSLMVKIANVLQNSKDAKKYQNLLPKIKEAFQREFLTKSGRLISHTQTAYTLALSFGLLPEEMIAIAAKRLDDDVNYFGHLTTGFLGTPLICQALTENGYVNTAYKLLFNKRYPSWLYPVTREATTIWERWDGIKPDGSFQNPGMNSFNHYAYGAVGNWLYKSVAGINIDENIPGYKRIIIKPHLTNKLNYAKASYLSPYGRILSHWESDGKEVRLHLEIPANTTAVIFLPSRNHESIYEADQKIEELEDIEIIDCNENTTKVEVVSGKYCFRCLQKNYNHE